MAGITFPYANIPLVDLRTGCITNAWQRTLLAIFQATNGAVSPLLYLEPDPVLPVQVPAYLMELDVPVRQDTSLLNEAPAADPANRVSTQTVLAALAFGEV